MIKQVFEITIRGQGEWGHASDVQYHIAAECSEEAVEEAKLIHCQNAGKGPDSKINCTLVELKTLCTLDKAR